MHIFPYKAGSKSAKTLAQALGVKRIKHTRSRFRPRPSKTVINWGASSLPSHVTGCTIVNKPEAVSKASSKLKSFQAMDGVARTPKWSTNRSEALSWLSEGKKVVCRTLLRANSGRGIVIANTEDELVDAPLYTEYVPKQQEYRIHVFQGEVFDTQRKARDRSVPDEDVNWAVRNMDGGFIFARNDGSVVPDDVKEQAIQAVQALGLDFGAVDVAYNEHRGKGYVLEVNTAPGLAGTTLDKYVEIFGGV